MEKRPVGRPRLSADQKAKPISKMIRVPLGIADELKILAVMFKTQEISLNDIRQLIKRGNNNDLR